MSEGWHDVNEGWYELKVSPDAPPAFSEGELRHGELIGWYTIAYSERRRAERLHQALVDVGVIARTRMTHNNHPEAYDCWACILAELSNEALGSPISPRRST